MACLITDKVTLRNLRVNGEDAWWVDSEWNSETEDWETIRLGTIVADSLGSNEGEKVEIAFRDVVLHYWSDDADESQQVILNGTLADTLTQPSPDGAQYFPFLPVFANEPHSSAKTILSKADDTLTTQELQDALMGYVPLFEEIGALLAQADRDNTFQFMIPKGLYFGLADIPVNRIDLKLMRASMELSMAGFLFADAWEFPVALGTIYDQEGNDLLSREEILNQLNRSFGLKQDHRLDEAQLALTEGLGRLLEAHDLLSQVTVDGTIEQNPLTVEEYAELKDLVVVVQSSLSGAQTFGFVKPAVNINLGNLFLSPPDASRIDFDPFVLEEGKIRPVEAFFQKALEGSVDFDTAISYKKSFKAIRKGFGKVVFDEFHNFFSAGNRLWWFEEEEGDD